jgi:signal transduction histidine kinase
MPGSTRSVPTMNPVAPLLVRPRFWLLVVGIIALEAISGVLDFEFGDRIIPVAYLYTLPVLLGALYLGYPGGIGVPVLSAAVFHIEQGVLSHHLYEEADILFLAMLMIVGTMTARIQADRRRSREYGRQLERLAKAREELTALIVHDLRTPLSGLLMVLQLLDQEDRALLPEAHQQLVDVALVTGEDMAGMIGDLLHLHAIESGALELRRVKADAAEVIQSAVRHVEPLARARELEIRTETAPELPALWVDEGMIRRVVTNLLGNALRFSPDRGHITIRVERSGAEAVFSVADEGPGIPLDLQRKVFEKFARADEEASKHISTGLGLTFAKLAVEAHGGRIWVDSPWPPPASAEPGRGTRFSFALPLGQLPVR